MFRHFFRRRLSESERLRLYMEASRLGQQRLAALPEPPAKRRPTPLRVPQSSSHNSSRGLAALIPGAKPFDPFTLTPPQF